MRRDPRTPYAVANTDVTVSGTGETYFGARAVEAYLHESAAPRLIGQDPRRIEGIARELQPYVGFSGTGTESRGRSSIRATTQTPRRSACAGSTTS